MASAGRQEVHAVSSTPPPPPPTPTPPPPPPPPAPLPSPAQPHPAHPCVFRQRRDACTALDRPPAAAHTDGAARCRHAPARRRCEAAGGGQQWVQSVAGREQASNRPHRPAGQYHASTASPPRHNAALPPKPQPHPMPGMNQVSQSAGASLTQEPAPPGIQNSASVSK